MSVKNNITKYMLYFSVQLNATRACTFVACNQFCKHNCNLDIQEQQVQEVPVKSKVSDQFHLGSSRGHMSTHHLYLEVRLVTISYTGKQMISMLKILLLKATTSIFRPGALCQFFPRLHINIEVFKLSLGSQNKVYNLHKSNHTTAALENSHHTSCTNADITAFIAL